MTQKKVVHKLYMHGGRSGPVVFMTACGLDGDRLTLAKVYDWKHVTCKNCLRTYEGKR